MPHRTEPESGKSQGLNSASKSADPLHGLFGAGDQLFAQPLLRALAANRDETVDRALDMYQRHFGDARTLSDVEFRLNFGAIIDAAATLTKGAKADSNVTFLDHCRQVGENLASRRIPFSEFIVALYFFEDACLANHGVQHDSRLDRAFDRMSHQVIGGVASAYVARTSGEAAALRASLERDAMRLAPGSRTVFHGLVGRSAAMRRLYARLGAAAPRKTTVLLVGETGTGKELCARALHELSDRRRGPFVPVNCAAISREILASELFGHRRGAFTGAVADSKGLIASAELGTLFLDEVTEMDEAAQVALLRVLEQHAVRAIGSTGEKPINVRFVAATNRNPDEAVASGKLRLDLYHRLAATTIEVPPLRERIEDLPLLVDYFLARIAATESIAIPKLSGEALSALQQYPWPGNVRELANSLESAAMFASDCEIQKADFPERMFRGAAQPKSERETPLPSAPAAAAPAAASSRDQRLTLHEAELQQIRSAVAEYHGNKAAAARALGISRKRLYAKLRELGEHVGPEEADEKE